MTAAQVARALGRHPRSMQRRAVREDWPYRERPCRGGRRRLYAVKSLPADIRAAALADRRSVGAAPQEPLNAPSTAVAGAEKNGGLDFTPAPPRPRGRPVAECCPEAWATFKADWLRPEAPTAEASARAVLRIAASRGWSPAPRYAKYYLRRIERELSPQAVTLARQGREALDRMRPPQIRDREALASMEICCADGHRWDVRVEWPNGIVARPLLVGWQDIRSAKILSFRIGPSETSDLYRLSCADMLWECGAPEAVIVDNGRGIAAKCLTGGLPNRYRGKVQPEDPTGLLTELVGAGNVHWTVPYSGQSKPIERSFRDFASDIAKDIRLRGAYTGKDTVSKPANYGARSIPLETFRAVVADGVAQHNARAGRRGLGMRDRSCDQVFKACFGQVRRLSPRELGRWLLAMQGVTARASDGSVEIFGTRYWCEELAAAFAGRSKAARRAVVRFDPERLDRPALVERPDGRPAGIAAPLGRVAYLDAGAAKEHARARHRARKAAREELDAALRLDAAAAGALLDEAAGPPGAGPPNVLEVEFAAPDPGQAEEDELIRQGEEYTLALALGGSD